MPRFVAPPIWARRCEAANLGELSSSQAMETHTGKKQRMEPGGADGTSGPIQREVLRTTLLTSELSPMLELTRAGLPAGSHLLELLTVRLT